MTRRKQRTATTDEGRESQLISMAQDLAERQLLEGTASSQVITHFLKIGSTRERIEQERLKREVELLEARVESLQSASRIEHLFEDAMKAFRGYSGQDDYDDYEDEMEGYEE